jgi:hypothetical protein
MYSEGSLFDGNDDGSFVPFTDILLNVSMGFAFIVFIAFALIRPDLETGNVNLDAQYLITINWPDGSPDDVDLYVQDPSGGVVWYRTLESGMLSLERDDRGLFRDVMVVNGKRIENPLNQESVALRGIVAGEYTVNIYHYVATGVDPVPVNVKVERLNPSVQVVYYGTHELKERGHEITAVRFTLDEEGNASAINDRFKSLTQVARAL